MVEKKIGQWVRYTGETDASGKHGRSRCGKMETFTDSVGWKLRGQVCKAGERCREKDELAGSARHES